MPVEKIVYTENLRQGTDKLNDAIDQSNEAITKATTSETTANQALTNSESTQTQLDTVVIDGDSSVEAAQARVSDPKGTTFTVLKDRLDAGEQDLVTHKADNAKIFKQGGSFVDKMIKLMRVRGMYAYVNSSILKIGIGLNDGLGSVIEYHFLNNADNMLLLRGVKSGVESTTETDTAIDATLTGTYVSTSAPNTYTATPGDSFESTFSGYKIVNFKRLRETRGGIWEFKITQGGLEVRDRKIESCYGDSTALSETLLFDDLDPRLEYVVTGTFLGDDPNHAPSTSPSRGYIYYTAADLLQRPIIARNIVRPINTSTSKEIISSSSIPDFAISAKPYGAIYSSEWVPAHTVSGVSGSVGVKLLVDGYDMNISPGVLPSFTYRQIDDFELSQYFQALNPNGADGAMWDHYITHSIRQNNPYLTVQNGLKFLQDTDVGSAYLAMLPSKQSNMYNLVLNNGAIYDTLLTDGSQDTFDWDVTSAMFTGEYAAGNYHACALDISSLREATGYKMDYEPSNPGLIAFRTDDIVKLYFLENSPNTKFVIGDKLSCTQRISCITGVRSPNQYLKSLY